MADGYEFKQVSVRLKLSESEPIYSTEPINTPDKAVEIMAKVLSQMDREYCCVVNLDNANHPINFNVVSIGDVNQAHVPIQNVFKSAILSNATSIMLFHNHPSGSVRASIEDIEITKRLIEAGSIMNIPVTDHIIVAGGTAERYSFRESKPDMFNVFEHGAYVVRDPDADEEAFKIGNRYISIQRTDEGYDYSIYNERFSLLDGGVMGDADLTMKDVLDMITDELKEPVYDRERDTYIHTKIQGNIKPTDMPVPIDHDDLMMKADAVGQTEIMQIKSEQQIVADFRAATERLYHPERLGGKRIEDIEGQVREMVQETIDTYNLDARIKDVILTGSRCRGVERKDSDIDVVVSFSGKEREDDLFNLMHEELTMTGGAVLDINPINEKETGLLADYLTVAEAFLAKKMKQQDLNYKKPALELLDKYGYEPAEQGKEQDYILVKSLSDREILGFDSFGMIRDYFRDVDRLINEYDIETLQNRLAGENSVIPFGLGDEQLRAAIRYMEDHPLEMTKNKSAQVVTYTVAENSEFHSRGALHKGIPTLQDAIRLYEKILTENKPSEVPAIGINVHTRGTSVREDMSCDVFSDNHIDLDALRYIPEMSQNAEVCEALYQLADAYPKAVITGVFPDEYSKMQINRTEDTDRAEKQLTSAELAKQIDDFAYSYDTVGYKESVSDRYKNVVNIQKDLDNHKTGYLKDVMKGIVEDETSSRDDVKQAQEILKKLNDYKPLAKIEEMQEQNYNMIDNVINNTPPKKEEVKEQEKPKKPRIEEHRDYGGCVSMKELLAEKMAIIAERESRSQETEKAKKTEPCLSGDQ